jgi:hypothetical protein
VTGDIWNLMTGAHAKSSFPAAEACRVAKRFVAGHVLYVSRKINSRRATLTKIEHVDELWHLSARVPPPGWRLFGRFLHQDVMIVMRAVDRHDLGGMRRLNVKAREIAEDITEEWDQKLPGLDPVRSPHLSDYLTGLWRDLDEPVI